MAGPPYPPNPTVGSNAIGDFVIGVSQIGDISAFNFWATLLAQYADSPIITSMISSFNAALDQTEDFSNFYDWIWDVTTAQGYGLDVLGRIVGVDRSVPVSGGIGPTFGFNEPGNDWVGFGQAPFTSGSSPTTNVTMTDAQFRPVVLAKAATNVWDGSIPGLNAILLGLFQGRGNVYVVDGQNMSLTYVFEFALSALDVGVVQESGCLPEPSGVAINLSYA